MAHTKSGGKARQKTNVSGKRLGLKISGGQKVKSGNILIRQRGTQYHPGEGTDIGKDYTLFATRDGQVKFTKKQGKNMVKVI